LDDEVVNEAKQLLTGMTYCWECVYLCLKEVDVFVCAKNSDKKILNISTDGCLKIIKPLSIIHRLY